MSLVLEGRCWKLGDDVPSDELISARHVYEYDPRQLRKHLLAELRPAFAAEAAAGDILLVGKRFSHGSQHTHPFLAMKEMGLGLVARTLARPPFRLAIYTGVPVLEIGEAGAATLADGDRLRVDFATGRLDNLTHGTQLQLAPLPGFLLDIVRAGGGLPYLRDSVGAPTQPPDRAATADLPMTVALRAATPSEPVAVGAPAPGRSAAPLIQIDGLEKSYRSRDGSRVRALGPVTLDIRQGEFLTIVGPSGCGKSTLLRLLAGLLPRSAGTIRIGGREIVGPQQDIGVVFQAPVLLPWRTAVENVMLPAAVQRQDKTKSRARALELLALVGLHDFAGKYPTELSGGMQQRVAIARALMHEPSTLLMDEPFGALDAMTRENMNVEIRRLWAEAGKTIVFVTHSIPEAVFLGTRVLVLSNRPGQIAELIEVDLGPERSLDLVASDAFGVYTKRIRRHFQARGAIE